MKNCFLPIIISSLLIFAVGCGGARHKPMYYWGGYSASLYDYKKEPSEDTRQKHIASLLNLFEKSKEMELRVPPGIYSEYGSMMLEDGKKEIAVEYFLKEKSTYPESSVMMDRILQNVGEI